MEKDKELIEAFTRQADFYDWDRYQNLQKPSNIRLKQLVERDLDRYLIGRSVFEIAAGTGYWGRYLMDKGYRYRGVEITPAFVDKAHEKGVLTERLGDARSLDSYPREVDNIICIKAFSFIKDPVNVLSHCDKSLRKGGRLLIWYYNKDFHILNFLLKLKGTSIPKLTPLELRHSQKEMRQMLNHEGFRILELQDYINFSYRFIPKFLRNNKVVHWMDDHLKYGWITFVAAEKA